MPDYPGAFGLSQRIHDWSATIESLPKEPLSFTAAYGGGEGEGRRSLVPIM